MFFWACVCALLAVCSASGKKKNADRTETSWCKISKREPDQWSSLKVVLHSRSGARFQFSPSGPVKAGRSRAAERPRRPLRRRTGPLHQHRQLVPTAGTPQAQLQSNTHTFCHASRRRRNPRKLVLKLWGLRCYQTRSQSWHLNALTRSLFRPIHVHLRAQPTCPHISTVLATDGNTWSESELDSHRELTDATVDTTATNTATARGRGQDRNSKSVLLL